MTKPTVSVVMITYAHEQFIKQAIEGVLMQQCDFDVELIIADDCSPDTTESIVNDICQTHPNASWIKYTKHKNNLGMMPNFIFALEQAEGKFIALCEGDDYWIDPLKLKKQVDVFKKYPETVICGTRAKTWDENTQEFKELTPPVDIKETHFNTNDFFNKKIWVKNCTRMFKKVDLLNIPHKYLIDFLLINYLIATNPEKLIVALPDITTVYREHGGGVYSSKTQIQKDISNYRVNLDLAGLYNGKKRKAILKFTRTLALRLYNTEALGMKGRLFYFLECIRLNPKLTIYELYNKFYK